MSQKNIRKLNITIFIMIFIGIVTFLSGFLKYTPFEHISLFLFFLLALGGAKLISGANKSILSGYVKFFLIFTGITTMLFMLLITIAIVKTFISDVSLSDNIESFEGLFYFTSLLFLIGIIGCILFLNIQGSDNSNQINN